ncbi:Uncharacterized conserved protein, DUF1800 family [Chitinophaga sp. CF118]|uniref:DUF1800 domain-containing protein n=1 Tax=Chitinophaga sp. CF118 TaxID=1884367 RepID=UPI0008E379BE|nr:DUF1800 domain-containing protein [Chitinophaga sp. CF118]SFD14912.1 Uncharacterized conserved protein, DUF1800 family [Chitinophaga sp. CF118]
MDRRQFLTLSPQRQKAVKANITGGRTDSGVGAYTGTFDTGQAVHLLKRTMFGATPADVAWCKGLGMDQAVEALLTTITTVSTSPLNTYGDDITGIAPGATWVNSAPPPAATDDLDLDKMRRPTYQAWWLSVMLSQGRSIQEKMVLFWNNHFSTEADKVLDARLLYRYNNMFRANGLGNFKALVKAVTLDPAMLIYLNGNLNGKEVADENYARELQELFTVGKGSGSHYTEEDVRAAARVLTGFRVDPVTMTSYFDTTQHEITNKEFSDFYLNKKVSGQTGPAGATELDSLLDIIFSANEVAKHICRKLYRFFVYYLIDDAVETNVISPLADIFRNSGFEIAPVLRALFKSEHFYDPLNMSCLIKSPVDFTVGMCREFGVKFPTAYMDAYTAWDTMRDYMAKMLQDIGQPPTVAGWDAYYQEPQFHELWINTDTLPKRNRLSDSLVSAGGFEGLKIDVLAFADQLSAPSDPVALVKDSLDILYRIDVSDATRSWLKNTILLSGQNPDSDYYWTDAWNDYKSNPGNASYQQIIESRLQTLYKYIMDLSEYQLA